MAEHIVKHYTCDRCDIDMGADLPKDDLRVTACKFGEWAVEFKYEWSHLCCECRADIVAFFNRREM